MIKYAIYPMMKGGNELSSFEFTTRFPCSDKLLEVNMLSGNYAGKLLLCVWDTESNNAPTIDVYNIDNPFSLEYADFCRWLDANYGDFKREE